MSYFNNVNDANPDFTSSVYEEFDPYLVLGQTSAGEWAFDTSIHDLGMVEQPGLMVGSSSSRATTSYGKYHCNQFAVGHLMRMSAEPVASASPYTTELNSCGQLAYPSHSWQTIGHQTQTHNSGFQSQDDFFQCTMASESSAVVPTPSSGKDPSALDLLGTSTDQSRIGLLNYWGTNQSGSSVGTFYTVSARAQSSYVTILTPFHSRTCNLPISLALVQPGLGRFL